MANEKSALQTNNDSNSIFISSFFLEFNINVYKSTRTNTFIKNLSVEVRFGFHIWYTLYAYELLGVFPLSLSLLMCAYIMLSRVRFQFADLPFYLSNDIGRKAMFFRTEYSHKSYCISKEREEKRKIAEKSVW